MFKALGPRYAGPIETAPTYPPVDLTREGPPAWPTVDLEAQRPITGSGIVMLALLAAAILGGAAAAML